jgi:tellurite resistance protein TerC
VHVSTAWWAGTLAFLAALLVVDLVLSGRLAARSGTTDGAPPHSGRWVLFYVAVALGFGGLLAAEFGPSYAGQFVAGWLTEYSLSVDNLFVFIVLMARFSVPQKLQLRVLTVGIVLALVLRGILIVVGAAVLDRFSWVFYVFALFLLWTAWSLLRGDDAVHSGNRPADTVSDQQEPATVRLLQRLLPTTSTWHGARLVVRERRLRDRVLLGKRGKRGRGRLVATPMLLTMVAIGVTDVLFALDSIPAIFGLTREPFLVVCANAFALIGLRQLFFTVRGLLDRLAHLDKGLSLVLAFIGVKLGLEALHDNTLPFVNGGEPVGWAPHIPTAVSLGVVAGILATTAAAGLLTRRRDRPAPPATDQPRKAA